MAVFCSLFSGSSGNSVYIESGGDGVLIDAGVSLKSIRTALAAVGAGIERVRAVFITHEHSDHIRGLPVLAAHYDIPVYASPGTVQGIAAETKLPAERMTALTTGCCAEVGESLCVSSFVTSHDSRESVGFHIHAGAADVAVVTDLGFVTEPVWQGIQNCRLVMLESNHDVGMLCNGRYPYFLKKRILSRTGHLSNDDCAAVLPELVQGGAEHFVLAHLSRDNNFPELALETSVSQMKMHQLEADRDYTIEAAPRSGPGRVYSL